MSETLHSEVSQEMPDVQINIDNKIFDQFDDIANHLPEGKDKDFFYQIISLVKKGLFEYLEETLDFILSDDKKEEKNKKISHKIENILTTLDQILNDVGIPHHLSEESKEKAYRNFKRVALDYALKHVLDYEKRVMENKMDSEEFIKETNLDGIVDGEYIEKVLIDKINKLPVDVRDNLVLPNERILTEKTQ